MGNVTEQLRASLTLESPGAEGQRALMSGLLRTINDSALTPEQRRAKYEDTCDPILRRDRRLLSPLDVLLNRCRQDSYIVVWQAKDSSLHMRETPIGFDRAKAVELVLEDPDSVIVLRGSLGDPLVDVSGEISGLIIEKIEADVIPPADLYDLYGDHKFFEMHLPKALKEWHRHTPSDARDYAWEGV